MKIAVNKDRYFDTIESLHKIDVTDISTFTFFYVKELKNTVIIYKNTKGGHDYRLDDAGLNQLCEVVEDNYDFEANDKNEVLISDIEGKLPLYFYDLKEKIKADYQNKKQDGQRYFEEVQAEIANMVKNGSITELQAFEIEAQIDEPFNKLLRGDWKTSHYMLQLITPTGAYTQQMYDEHLDYISNYITENYTL